MTESPTITLSQLLDDPEDAKYLIEHSDEPIVLTDDDGVPIARLLAVDETDDDTDDDEPADAELSIEDEPFEELDCFDDAFEIGAE